MSRVLCICLLLCVLATSVHVRAYVVVATEPVEITAWHSPDSSSSHESSSHESSSHSHESSSVHSLDSSVHSLDSSVHSLDSSAHSLDSSVHSVDSSSAIHMSSHEHSGSNRFEAPRLPTGSDVPEARPNTADFAEMDHAMGRAKAIWHELKADHKENLPRGTVGAFLGAWAHCYRSLVNEGRVIDTDGYKAIHTYTVVSELATNMLKGHFTASGEGRDVHVTLSSPVSVEHLRLLVEFQAATSRMMELLFGRSPKEPPM